MYSFCRVIEINEPSFLVGLLLMATDEIKQMSNQLLRLLQRDFCAHFTRVEMVSPDSLAINSINAKSWETSKFEGAWVKGLTPGGCRNYIGVCIELWNYILVLVSLCAIQGWEFALSLILSFAQNRSF